MAFINGTFTGGVAFLIATIAYVIIAMTLFLRSDPRATGIEVGFDASPLLTSPVNWLIGSAAFALGFYSEFDEGKKTGGFHTLKEFPREVIRFYT